MKLPVNPYLNRSMVRSPAAFFGRRREAARLAARLASTPPQSVALIGDRRIGKSSLLYHISEPSVAAEYLEDPEHTIFLLLDFQEEQRPSIETFIAAVFHGLEEKLPEGWERPPEANYEGLQQVVRDLDRRGVRLILLLDEFDRVTRSSRFDADFFAYLRSLAGHHNVAYVTATTRDLQQLCHTQEIADSPFFNIFGSIRLGPFGPEEALELIRQPSAATPFPLEPHSGLILDLAGRLPFFLQIACSAVFEVMLEEGECDAGRVEGRFLEEAEPHFRFYWEQMGPVERAVCNQLARGEEADAARPEYRDLARRGFILGDGLFSRPFAEFVTRAYAQDVGDEPVEVQAERLRSMTGELEKAREMQLGLMPQEAPRAPGLDVAGRCEPASHVGGDFFSYLWLDDQRTRLAVVGVDVMGHGMEAAVTALRFSETLRYEYRGHTGPRAIMEALNRSACAMLQGRVFVGCGITVLDLAGRRAETAVAGYHPPLHYVRHLDRVVDLEMGNTPLGVRVDSPYEERGLELGEGDYLLLFSDGAIEANDDRDHPYGEERLRDLLAAGAREGLSAAALLERLFWDVGRYTASAGQGDDITAVVVRVGAPS